MEKGVLLCVDDEIIVLTALKDQLRRAFGSEFHIDVAESAEEALELLEELALDGHTLLVIVSDWLMPGMKGDEFLIQAHGRFPSVVKIMLSGQAESAAVDRARREAGLHDFLSKPWNAEALVESINQGLQERAA
ncbi:response regulator [Pseudoxanthomonas gei]|uniref:Response regulator n=1 Tax=Pseudoxanthomonas gei TaxID=1383030 RepID=A0ABX0AEY5_9GAMM|nr:response regulator [Pseudoxanthomonas gei]NDK39055.1 response regulator [Pseudoxanthomonas gei]